MPTGISPRTSYIHADECNLIFWIVNDWRPKYSGSTTSVPEIVLRDSRVTALTKCICHLTECTHNYNIHNQFLTINDHVRRPDHDGADRSAHGADHELAKKGDVAMPSRISSTSEAR